MTPRRENDLIHFSFSAMECRVLERVLGAIIANYKLPPDELDEKSAAVWYSRRGCQSARMSAEETADWVKQLFRLRGGRLEQLEKWLDQLQARAPGAFALTIPVESAELFMTALNDHRLLMAARHNVGEAEMDMRTFAALTTLPPEQQTALYEIHFLAYVIEELIHLLQKQS